MNSKTQAARGFKTFLLTLVVSLVVFSAIYFIINTEQDTEPTQPTKSSQQTLNAPFNKSTDTKTQTLGESDTREQPQVQPQPADVSAPVAVAEVAAGASVFEQLANQKMDVEPQRQVLAESDTADTTAMVATNNTEDTTEVAQSTVPNTGISGPTMGVILTLVILGFAAYVMFIGPRNIALYNFEKDVLDELD